MFRGLIPPIPDIWSHTSTVLLMPKDQVGLKARFAQLLLKWHHNKNTRAMPWKGENDPYRIWLSEIILQQTRVEQGQAYYLRFIEAFPDVNQLAASPDEKVFKVWEGLGYYSRCRNLLHTARHISGQLNGKFPTTYEDIKQLKGVGPYTAAAISSFAFNLPHPVVDGNVYRLLSRIFGIESPIDTSGGKKIFNELANELIDWKFAGLYNQAIMDYGAVICKPVVPLCASCIFRNDCFALNKQRIDEFPAKQKKTVNRRRWFYSIVIQKGSQKQMDLLAIRKRNARDIWQDLFEFPVIESDREQKLDYILQELQNTFGLCKNSYTLIAVSPKFKQQLTHQTITGQFINIRVKNKNTQQADWLWVSSTQLNKYSFPRYINQYLSETRLYHF